MQVKTSTKISLKFTLFATVVLVIFSVIIFFLFFGTRYTKQKSRLYVNTDYEPPFLLELIRISPTVSLSSSTRDPHIDREKMITSPRTGSVQFSFLSSGYERSAQLTPTTIVVREADESSPVSMGVVSSHQPSAVAIRKNHNFFASQDTTPLFQQVSLSEFLGDTTYVTQDFLFFISKGYISLFYKDGSFYVYDIQGDTVKFLDVTGFVYAQTELIQLLFVCGVVFMLFVYFISLYFVKSSLKNLKKLTRFAQNLDFNDLSPRLEISGHKADEIKLIADAFNASLQRIHDQILSLKDFIANASHELKTPLMMINSEIDIALKKKDYEERLLNIKDSTKRLSDLLDNLSLITRLESAPALQKEDVHLSTIVEQVIHDLHQKYPQKQISVSIDGDSIVESHPVLLEIVIKNLLENALKYAGAKAKVSFVADEYGFSIIDTGIGILPEYQEQIFERFWQLEKTEQAGHSFGLGLYLVKKIVELHGWTLDLESEPKKGSTFRISFN